MRPRMAILALVGVVLVVAVITDGADTDGLGGEFGDQRAVGQVRAAHQHSMFHRAADLGGCVTHTLTMNPRLSPTPA
jgi:hypothetical protein